MPQLSKKMTNMTFFWDLDRKHLVGLGSSFVNHCMSAVFLRGSYVNIQDSSVATILLRMFGSVLISSRWARAKSILVLLCALVSRCGTNLEASLFILRSFFSTFKAVVWDISAAAAIWRVVRHQSSSTICSTLCTLSSVRWETGRPDLLLSLTGVVGSAWNTLNQWQIWVWLRAWSSKAALILLIVWATSNPHATHAFMVNLCSFLHSKVAQRSRKTHFKNAIANTCTQHCRYSPCTATLNSAIDLKTNLRDLKTKIFDHASSQQWQTSGSPPQKAFKEI